MTCMLIVHSSRLLQTCEWILDIQLVVVPGSLMKCLLSAGSFVTCLDSSTVYTSHGLTTYSGIVAAGQSNYIQVTLQSMVLTD